MTKILKVIESNGFVKVYRLFNLESEPKITCPCDDGESEKCICQHRAGENFDNYYD